MLVINCIIIIMLVSLNYYYYFIIKVAKGWKMSAKYLETFQKFLKLSK